MKLFCKIFLIALLGTFGLGQIKSSAEVSVSFGVPVNSPDEFYQPLAPYGSWIDVPRYGRCWRPNVDPDWRPYCDGQWVWTDVGWYWQSEEPWAWACYHYGSWADEPGIGWFWVPGLEWAPAWVDWRFGGGYCGWAPSPPIGFVLEPTAFVFVEAHRFHHHFHRRDVIVNNQTIINRTSRIASIRREPREIGGRRREVIVNEGPGVARIEKAGGQRFNREPVQEVARQTPTPQMQPGRTREFWQEQRRPEVRQNQVQTERRITPERRTQVAPAQRPSPSVQQRGEIHEPSGARPAPVVPQPAEPRVEKPAPQIERPAPQVERPMPPARQEVERSAPQVERPTPPVTRPMPRIEPEHRVAPSPGREIHPAPARPAAPAVHPAQPFDGRGRDRDRDH